MSKKSHEFKRLTFPGLVTKVDEAAGIVTATVNVLGIIDAGEDIVEKGAFLKTIQENFGRIRALDSHQTRSVLHAVGKPIKLAEISRADLPDQLKNDYPMATGGLYTETQFMLDDPTSLAVFKRLKEGYVTEWSIGFEIIQQDYRKVKDVDGKERVVRVIKEARLMEYSCVLWGMNSATYTETVKSDDSPAAEEAASAPLPDDQKEMTPDGPMMRLGDRIKGAVYDRYMSLCNGLYEMGWLSAEEHRGMCEAGMRMLDVIDAGMGEDVALRPLMNSSMFGGAFNGEVWSAEALDRLQKAGRTISAATGTQLQTALDTIYQGCELVEELLTAAGVLGNDEDESMEDAAKSAAEPDTAPLTSLDYALEIDLLENEINLEM
jgi:HK97 family phage prohead protease